MEKGLSQYFSIPMMNGFAGKKSLQGDEKNEKLKIT